MPSPRMEPVSLESPPEEVRETFQSFLAKRGNVPNLFRTLARRPEVMRAYATLLDKVMNTGTVETALKEMAVIRVSLINACEY
jgi:alkylhydroperoxidase family enzyme